MVYQNYIKKVMGQHPPVDVGRIPANVHVIVTPSFGLPMDPFYGLSGKAHYRSVRKRIPGKIAEIELIHCHFAWTAGYVGAKLREQLKKPVVVTCHGYDIYDLPFRNERWKARIENILNSVDQIITVSESNRRCIEKLSVSTPVSVIPNGFRKDLFYPRDREECRKKLDLPLERDTVLAVGNLVPVKGHEYLVRAIGILAEKRKDILCVIVGDGKSKESLNEEIHKLGLGKNVLLVGGKPHDEIPIWMGAADLVVLSSLNEGNPTVLVEALGCGKPFISTKVGGVPEVIESDEMGLLVEPANPVDLAEKILSGLEKKWDRNVILEHSRRYAWERISHDIAGVYEKTLQR
jgi:glycosyltransferase involved in cell wall biosynthesis